MKKFIISLLILMFVVSMVFVGVGCKTATTETTTAAETTAAETTAAETTAAATTAAEARPATITFWNHAVAADTAWEAKYWADTVAGFETEHPDIKVDLEWVPWDTFWAKLTAAVESGNPPDLHHAGDVHMMSFVPDGEVLPIDDLYQELGGADAFSPLFHYYQLDGHTYGLPYLEGGYIFFYNKEILSAAGYNEPPKTMDEMLEIAQAVTDPAKGIYGIGVDYSAGNGGEQVFQNFQKAFGGGVIDENRKVIFDSPENRAALQFYTDLGVKYKVVPPGVTAISSYETTASPLVSMFGNKQIAMMVYWQLGADQLKEQFPEIWKNTGVSLIPAGPSGHSGSFAAANSINIFSKTKYPEASKEFLRYIFQPKIYGDWIAGSGWIPGLNAAWQYQPAAEWRDAAREQMATMTRGFDPLGSDPKNGAAWEAFIKATAIQDIVVRNMSVDEAVKKAQKAYEDIYK